MLKKTKKPYRFCTILRKKMNQFEKMGIDEDFNPFYDEFNITGPTDVQAKVIPKIMKGSFSNPDDQNKRLGSSNSKPNTMTGFN